MEDSRAPRPRPDSAPPSSRRPSLASSAPPPPSSRSSVIPPARVSTVPAAPRSIREAPAPRPSSMPGARPPASIAPPAPSASTSPPRISVAPASRASVAPSRPPATYPEVILAFSAYRDAVPSCTAFRSTWIVSSLQSLRERGHFERYDELLGAHRQAILECVAGMWLPIDAARAHYDACDALNLDIEEQVAMGRAVGDRAQGSILATTAKAARGVGVTPWAILPLFDRLWRRATIGGAVEVTRLGPKEARAELVGCPLLDINYFRHAFRGVLLGIGAMFCQRPYVHDMPRRASGEAAFHLQWV